MEKSNCSLCGEKFNKLTQSTVDQGSSVLVFRLCETCVQTILSQLKIPADIKPIAEGLPALNRDYDKMLKKIGKSDAKNHKK